jgi:hypothetical protein
VIRRTVTAALWFAVGWALGGFLAYVAGTPVALAPAAGLVAATLVAWDPAGMLWGPKPDRKRIARRIADLERVSPATSGRAPDHTLEPAAD